MTRSEFKALYGRARLRETPSRDAAYLVPVSGARPSVAAREAGTSPQALTNILRKLKDATEEPAGHGRAHSPAQPHIQN